MEWHVAEPDPDCLPVEVGRCAVRLFSKGGGGEQCPRSGRLRPPSNATAWWFTGKVLCNDHESLYRAMVSAPR